MKIGKVAHYYGIKKRYVINFGILKYTKASHETVQIDLQSGSNHQIEGIAKIIPRPAFQLTDYRFRLQPKV